MKIVNHKAYRNYRVLETVEAGIVLVGSEVKSVREGRVDLSPGFAKIQKGEVILKNVLIPPYQQQSKDYNPRRDRKLLLHKDQINYLAGKIAQGGNLLVPLSAYLKRNIVKVGIGLVFHATKHDHRQKLAEQDEKKRLEQELKDVY